MSKSKTDKTSNDLICMAIRSIALKGVVKSSTGAIRGNGRTAGYVAKIHADGELAGTIDVQEYIMTAVEETENDKMGYHEGVLLSALQDNSKGYIIIPKLYSEVIIATDAETQNEYVVMFSHVDTIQLDSHETISMGVKEREEFKVDDDNAPDIDELAETGVKTNTTYTKNTIVSEVQDESNADHTKQVMDGKKISQIVGDDKSTVTLTQADIKAKHSQGELLINDSESTVTQGNSEVKVTNGVVYVGSHSGVDDAVLGCALADVLDGLLGALQTVSTNTALGPQPFINLPQFVSIKSRIIGYKAAHSGFLTPKVQIQK